MDFHNNPTTTFESPIYDIEMHVKIAKPNEWMSNYLSTYRDIPSEYKKRQYTFITQLLGKTIKNYIMCTIICNCKINKIVII